MDLLNDKSARHTAATAAVWMLAVTTPGTARAAYLSPPTDPGQLIWAANYMYAGTTYTIETANLTAGDTVLHVLDPANDTWGDDDGGPGVASRLVMVPVYTGLHRILVRSFSPSSAGRADLYVNGSRIVTQAPFGGSKYSTTWAAGERFGVAGTERGKGNDFMLFLLSSNTTLFQWDDDAGPNRYPLVTAAANATGSNPQVVWGLYPGSTGMGRVHQQANPSCAWIFGNDWDCDGLTDALEAVAGTDGSMGDTDLDGIPDYYELVGSEGWSFSEGGTPQTQEIYVEADFMGGTPSRQPYANLATDVQTMFDSEANREITVIVDDTLTRHEFITFYDNCPTGSDCVDFDTVKAASHDLGGTVGNPYFHYIVFGDKLVGADGKATCASGEGEVFGNDFVVTLGCGSITAQKQLGTFVHELGHNLNLLHNGNEDNYGANSTVHASVMNYRYQMIGVPPGSQFRYSHGLGGCASCYTSPKASCVTARAMGACPSNPRCDCDLDEWNALSLNFLAGAGGADGAESEQSPVTRADALGKRFTKANSRPLTAEERIELAPLEDLAARRLRVQHKVVELEARGEKRGQTFNLTPDGRRVLMR